MDEGDVGITRFTTPAARRFAGILKHRFQDFQVSEIDLAGRTACLISTEAPAQVRRSWCGCAVGGCSDGCSASVVWCQVLLLLLRIKH
jgi:hypothetical protein